MNNTAAWTHPAECTCPTCQTNDALGYDADVEESSQYCRHGTFIGSWWGPDYLCHLCESGLDYCEWPLCGKLVGGDYADESDEERGYCVLPIEGHIFCETHLLQLREWGMDRVTDDALWWG